MGKDILDGGEGVDTLIGGIGDDLYLVDNANDVIIENTVEGNDSVQSSVTYTLGNNIENLTLTGTAVINATGNTLDNLLIGNDRVNTLSALAGNDILDGGAGADSLVGGTGDDLYIVDNALDIITEASNEGADLVQSKVSYALGDNVENLTLTGDIATLAIGNALDNMLTGNAADNTIDGGAGADIMVGGEGDDLFLVDNTGDIASEYLDEGNDVVWASVSYTLGANVENLVLTQGSGTLQGSGNMLNNTLIGNESANTLFGDAGNDSLDGGAGIDSLAGGTGDDSYVVDHASDVVVENSSEGTDTVFSGINWTLGSNVENLTLTGTSALTGTGNSLNNTLSGNTGNSTLVGSTGNDTYVVSDTDTVITENSSEGTDVVQASINYTLGSNVENLTLTGLFSLTGTGNTLTNVLTGNDAANTLDGASGADTLVGELGNDLYIVDNTGDVVTEASDEGTDTVQTSVNYTLASSVENITLTGGSALTGTGNSLDNTLTGNNAASTLVGGAGNDTYIVQHASTVITENSASGTDAVQSSVSYTLGSNVENLTLTGSSALTGTGNTLDNKLTANDAASTLIGGTGNDTYSINNVGTVITENNAEGTDLVQASVSYTLGSHTENLTLTGTAALTGTGNSLANTLTDNLGNSTLVGGSGNDTYVVTDTDTIITENTSEGTDLVQAAVSYTLSADIENLTLTGLENISGTGNASVNTITGNAGKNTLTGGSGNDTLVGGTGDDYYVIDSGDTVTENSSEGTDTVQVDFNYTLGSNLENIVLTGGSAVTATGSSGANMITGNNMGSTLTGGAGNDTYVVSNTADEIVETTSNGTDTVISLGNYRGLEDHVENMTLQGNLAVFADGNALNNVLTGTDLFNKLSGFGGNDTLDGKGGADELLGGDGDDKYIVDNVDDIVYEAWNETGTDTVESSVTYTLSDFIENLTLTGEVITNATGNWMANYLTGNAATNTLVGLDDNDTLNGGAGADTLVGGTGDDLYIVDHLLDTILENSGEGTDSVQSSVGYTIGENVEFLTLTGTSSISGKGNSGANTITGNTGNNTLDGAAGADTMVGGTGDDTYVVDNASDVVTESSSAGTDTVETNISYTLGSNVENITLTGTSDLTATGNSDNNVLTGNIGSSTLVGGSGNDTYVLKNTNTTITEGSSAGTDTVEVDFNYTLGANLEKLTLTGTGNITGTGNSGNNTLTGSSGNDTLDGGAGVDSLIGGLGDDVFVVDNTSDNIREYAGEGVDLVLSADNYTLDDYIENLTLTRTSNYNGTGNTASNYITGNSGNNQLSGGQGNDTLSGGGGADTLAGGMGDDTFIVDSTTDVVDETWSEGTDTVETNITYTLADYLENLTLTGVLNINGTGNDWHNVMKGNSGNNILTGLEGDDTLDGGAGVDTLVGGVGNDRYVVDNLGDVITEGSNDGIDTVESSVNYILGQNLEYLTLTGSATSGTGNADNNLMLGTAAANYLNGGQGNDTMIGGGGNDFYVVDSEYDAVVESLKEGDDSVQSSASWVMSDNVENLTFTGTANTTGTGNALDNAITGNIGNNILIGNGGNDTLNGLGGMDVMYGGQGDDVYVIDKVSDIVSEVANEGIDTVQAYVSHTLASNFENVTLMGDKATTAVGNANNNTLIGNQINNALSGGDGDDTYKITTLEMRSDTITDTSGTDALDFSALSTGVSVDLSGTSFTGAANTGRSLPLLTGADGSTSVPDQFGITWSVQGNTEIQSADSWKTGEKYIDLDGTGDYIQTTGVVLNSDQWTVHWRASAADLDGTQYLVSGKDPDSFSLRFNEDSALELNLSSNGFSSDIANALTASKTDWETETWYEFEFSYDNTVGYRLYVNGQSVLSVNNTTEMWDPDGLVFGANYTGNSSLNGKIADMYITKNEVLHDFAYTPNGSSMVDLYGKNNELFWASNAIENLVGSTGNDTLTGNASANSLTGGKGNDTLTGAAGDDKYLFATGFGTDTIIDASGTDALDFSAFTEAVNVSLLSTSFTESSGNTVAWAGSTIENLTGGSGDDSLTGSTGGNTLVGGAGHDTLTGDDGNDSLLGGDGNDVYKLESGFGEDTINDASGTNTLDFSGFSSAVSVSIGSNTFTESAGNTVTWTAGDIKNLTGGSGNDSLAGSGDANTLAGGAGNDTLNGGAGDDAYRFAASFGTDTIIDASGTDTLDLSGFSSAVNANLSSSSFSDSTDSVSWSSGIVENLTGGSGNDTLLGDTGNNRISGGAGNDSVSGGSGNDTLLAGLGDDTLNGGANDDTYILESGVGKQLIVDASGADTIDLSAFTGGAKLDLSTPFDPSATNQKTAFNLNGQADNSTTLVDYFSNTWTAVGNAKIQSTTPWKTGEKHVDFDGSGDSIRSAGVGLNGDNWTVRFRLNADSLSGTQYAFFGYNSNSVVLKFVGDELRLGLSSNGTSDNIADVATNKTDWVTDKWYEIELNFDKNKGYHLFADGKNILTVSDTDKIYATGGLIFGASEGNAGGFNGQMSDFYISNTETLHTEDYTPLADNYMSTYLTDVDWTPNDIENASGGAGNDSITGTSANNVLAGNDGHDTLTGAAGDDTLSGGAGNDMYTFAASFGADSVVESAGTDTLNLSALSSNLSVDLTSTGLTESVGNTIDWAANSLENVLTGNGNDNIVGTTANNLLDAGNGNDTLAAGTGNDTLRGGDGNDIYVIGSNAGIDSLVEGLGTDTIDMSALSTGVNLSLAQSTYTDGSGNTLVWTAGALENLNTGSGNDSLEGNVGSNVLSGNDGNDTLVAGAGPDTLLGGDDNDVLQAGEDNDLLDGGAGNDIYQVTSNFGVDTIDDASGTDTLDFSAFTRSVTVDLSDTEFQDGTLANDNQHALLHFGGTDSSTTMTDEFGGTWTAYGNASIQSTDPWLAGQKQVALDGTGDYVQSNAIKYDGDEMTFRFRFRLDSSLNNQILVGGTGARPFYLMMNNDRLDLSISSNGISYDIANNSQTNKTDWAVDTWYEAEFSYSKTAGYKLFVDGQLDWVSASTSKMYSATGLTLGRDVNGLDGDIADFYLTNSQVLHTNNFVPKSIPYNTVDAISWTTNALENATGGSGNDTLIGNASANQLSGGDGADSLTAVAGNDSLLGGAGNDTLVGGADDDNLDGGAGNDYYVFASAFGEDTIVDASGTDTLDFSAFSSALTISLGSTSFTQSAGNTVYWTDGEIDNLTGGSGNDTLTGSSLANILTGGTGNDSLIGGAGDDQYRFAAGFGTDVISDASGSDMLDLSSFTTGVTANLATTSFTNGLDSVSWSSGILENVLGGSGNDSLVGNSSANLLAGGMGNDTLDGGSGDDTYRFSLGSQYDIVSDASGTDTLDFSNLTGNLTIDLNTTRVKDGTLNHLTDRSMLYFEGSDGTTTFPDEYGHGWSRFGTPTVQSSSSWKAGEKYIDFDGSGDYIKSTTVAYDGDEMSIRFRVRFDSSVSTSQVLLSGTDSRSLYLTMDTGRLDVSISSNGSTFDVANNSQTAKTTWATNTWYEIEFNYSQVNGYKLFVDGQLDWSLGSTSRIHEATGLVLGAWHNGTVGLNGAIADFYQTNTDVLHTSNFTPLSDRYMPDDYSAVNWTSSTMENAIGGSGNDSLVGTSAANSLSGFTGDDTLNGGTGNDVLNGGKGSDRYVFTVGDGEDTVIDTDSVVTDVDKVVFGSGSTTGNVALFMNSGDLQIGYSNNATDIVTIDFQSDDIPAIERVELSGGYYMSDADINAVISEMAAYISANSLSINSVSDVKNNEELMNIVASGWHT